MKEIIKDKAVITKCHSEGSVPAISGMGQKNRNECGVIPLSCFSGEEQFQRELASVRNCGEVKTVKHKTNLSAILKLTPFVKNSSSLANAGEGNMRTPRAAFTLAEVLITLTIIGVIAALTIPNLMQKWQDQHTVSAVKEAYAILSNAMKMAVRENGQMPEWSWDNSATKDQKNQHIGEILRPYLKVQKFCKVDDQSCIPYSKNFSSMLIHSYRYYELLKANTRNTTPESMNYKGWTVLNNGMIFAYRFWAGQENGLYNGGEIFVDINGKKGPNRYGYDAFNLMFQNSMLIVGSQKDCSNKNTDNGFYCSHWILKKGNVDYKYRDVSAEW